MGAHHTSPHLELSRARIGPHRDGERVAMRSRARPAVLGMLLFAMLLDRASALKRPFSSAQAPADDDDGKRAVSHAGEDASRPSRGSSGVFDTPEGDDAPAAASAEWDAANAGILNDMRAHLKRREKKAEADLIGRSPIGKLVDFFGSQYFRNVRKSVGIFLGAWFWYVLNTKTYIQPEYDE